MSGKGPEDVERLIEQALASYVACEPRPGLEQRVRARVHARDRRKWWFSAGALAAALAVLLMVRVRFSGADFSPRGTSVPPSPVEHVIADQAIPVKLKPKPAQRAPRPQPIIAKRSQFPTPAPPTPEERALVALVERYPAIAAEIVVGQRRSAEPIQIEPIQIEPLGNDQDKEQK